MAWRQGLFVLIDCLPTLTVWSKKNAQMTMRGYQNGLSRKIVVNW
jgi:hypothetical protein